MQTTLYFKSILWCTLLVWHGNCLLNDIWITNIILYNQLPTYVCDFVRKRIKKIGLFELYGTKIKMSHRNSTNIMIAVHLSVLFYTVWVLVKSRHWTSAAQTEPRGHAVEFILALNASNNKKSKCVGGWTEVVSNPGENIGRYLPCTWSERPDLFCARAHGHMTLGFVQHSSHFESRRTAGGALLINMCKINVSHQIGLWKGVVHFECLECGVKWQSKKKNLQVMAKIFISVFYNLFASQILALPI